MKSLTRLKILALGAGLLFVSAIASGCGDDNDVPSATAPSEATAATFAPISGEIVVFAAASLTDAFTEAADAFEAKHPGTTVTFNFASSSALAVQINEGAPADVFASADASQMNAVTDGDYDEGEPAIFVTNRLVVVVPEGSREVSAFADLANPGVKLVLAGADVPVGRYAREILSKASVDGDFSGRVLANLVSEESNVRAVLAKVQLGEADAGVVYATDAAIAGASVEIIEIPDAYNVTATYPIVALNGGSNDAGARAWIAFILSGEGQAILRKYGFGEAP